MLPPLLTVVIFLWVASTINTYVMQPVKNVSRTVIVWCYDDGVTDFPEVALDATMAEKDGVRYKRLPRTEGTKDQWLPEDIYSEVQANRGDAPVPTTRHAMLERYVDVSWLTPFKVLSVFTCIFVLTMYFLGKFLAAGMGRFAWASFEKVINRLPLIRNVYGSVKQVTDFVFSEANVEYTRVVAVEYPRKGIWSLGMVTGNGMLDIAAAANEPVLSVLIPTSPAPFTGFTVTIRKSEAVDLNLTIDQAFQFIVSCGVVIAPQQVCELTDDGSNLAGPAALTDDGIATGSDSAISAPGS